MERKGRGREVNSVNVGLSYCTTEVNDVTAAGLRADLAAAKVGQINARSDYICVRLGSVAFPPCDL